MFRGLESSPSSTASSAWRHAATAAEARPFPTAARNVAVEHGDGRILCIITSRTRQRETYTALTSRGARVCRIALDEPVTPRRGAWSAGAGSSFLYIVLVCRTEYNVCRILCIYICYCPCCMCACGATYSRLCGAHRRFSQHTPTRDAKPARLHCGALSCCMLHLYYKTVVLLHVRLRLRWPPLAGGAPWSPTRDHGPCEAWAKELRLSLGDDAHQEEQRVTTPNVVHIPRAPRHSPRSIASIPGVNEFHSG